MLQIDHRTRRFSWLRKIHSQFNNGYRCFWLVAVLLHAAALWQAEPLQSANERSRWCTVWSLSERNTFMIDEIRKTPGWDSIDIVQLNGHFYSTKPPLLSVIAAGLASLFKTIAAFDLIESPQPCTATILLFVNLVPWGASLWVIQDLLKVHARTRFAGVVLFALAAFGTLLTPFVATLNNHLPAACCIVATLSLLLRHSTRHSSDSSSQFVWLGFFCGLTCCFELPALAWMVYCGYWAIRHNSGLALKRFFPAAILPLVGSLALNLIAFEDWRPPYAQYGGAAYRFVEEGVPSYWLRPQGVDRNLDSPVVYLFHCLIGHHGVFSLTPAWMLLILAPISWKRLDGRWRRLIAGIAVVSAVVITFYLTRTENYNYGGVSCALRWTLWLVPLWLICLIPVLDRFSQAVPVVSLTYFLIGISILTAWSRASTPWQQPWVFNWMEAHSMIDYREPHTPLDVPQWTWISSIPETDAMGEAPFARWHLYLPNGKRRVRELRVLRKLPPPREDFSVIELIETEPDQAPQRREVAINVAAFKKGAKPAEAIQWLDPQVSAAQQQADLAWFRGLPTLNSYRPGPTVYLKSSLRTNAIECQRRICEVWVKPESEAQTSFDQIIYRVDVWNSPFVPFGAVRMEFQITDASRKHLLLKEQWNLVEVNPKPSPDEGVPVP